MLQRNRVLLFYGSFLLFYFICGIISADKFIYDPHGKKDPFTAPVTKEETNMNRMLAGISLKGILWDKEKPFAIINNKVVKIGDIVRGAKITDIKPNEVIFSINGRKAGLKLRVKEK